MLGRVRSPRYRLDGQPLVLLWQIADLLRKQPLCLRVDWICLLNSLLPCGLHPVYLPSELLSTVLPAGRKCTDNHHGFRL